MSSYRQILYHIIFRTKNGKKTLTKENSKELYAYILGIIKRKGCFLFRINGTEDHLHIFSDLHPSIALADFVRDIKTSSSIWLKQSGKFKEFDGWADGYAALTYAWKDKEMIVNYIINQIAHHQKDSFEDELRRLLKENGIEVDDRYFP
ncbi:MAG: IS200/IS605 family transposase [Tenuifilaceae bacterium]